MTAFVKEQRLLGRFIIRHPITLDFYTAEDFKYVVRTDHTVPGLNMHILMRSFTLKGFKPIPKVMDQEELDSFLVDYEIVELNQPSCQSAFIIRSVRTIDVVRTIGAGERTEASVEGWLSD